MLEWNVYYHDFNRKEINVFNVFNHWSFHEDCKKNAKKNSKDYEAFCEQLRKDAMYRFWSKCEYEILLTPWVGRAETLKIDIYDQLRLNWEQFCKYTWEHGVELRRREKKRE